MTITAFLKYLTNERRFSEHTLVAYRSDLEQFQRFLQHLYGDFQWQTLGTAQVRTWMAALLEEGHAPTTIRRKLSVVKSFYRYWRKQYPALKDPTKSIQTPKLQKRVLPVAAAADLARLFATFPVDTDFPISRDKLVLDLLYSTGLRRSELLTLEWKNILGPQQVLKVSGKGRKERLIPYGAPTATTINAYRQQYEAAFGSINSTDKVILTDKGKPPYPKWVYNKVKQYLSDFPRLERQSPHVLRHSYATHLSDAGAELNAIKELMGHKSLAATQVYTHNSIEKLKRAYQQAHPKAQESTE